MITGSEKVFDGKIIKVYVDRVRLPNGRDVLWERVEHPGAVGVVPLLPDGSVVMVRQYRNAVDGELLEIPAGKLNAGEPPAECAMRELEEEIGMKAGSMRKISEFYNSPGYSNERFFLYLATDLEEVPRKVEPDEFLKIEKYPLETLFKMVCSAEIRDAKSVIGISLAKILSSGNPWI